MPRTADGKVDMNAPPRRTRRRQTRSLGLLDADRPGEAPAQSRRRSEARRGAAAAVGAKRSTRNGSRTTARIIPGVRCWPSGIPEKNNIPDGLKVVQTPDLIDVPARVAHHLPADLHRRPAAAARTRSRRGWAIRSADGKATRFVVETIGQNGKTWLDMRGLPATEALQRDRALHAARTSATSTST